MKQKILGIILLVVMAFSVFALSSCERLEGLFPGGEVTDNHFKNIDMPLVYEIYLDYMEDIGEKPLSYDEWFEAIHGYEFQEGIIPLIEKNESSDFWEISFNNGKGWNDLQFKTENEVHKKCKHNFGKWVIISEGDDYFNGIRYRECKKCGYKDYQFKIDKDAPSHTHGFATTTTAPSCEAGGFDTKTCSCGYTEIVNKTAPLGHEYTDEYVSDATYHWKKCVRCDYTTAKEEHTRGEGDKCSVCGVEMAHTHKFTTTTTAPTCEAGGFDTKTCSCGYTEIVNKTAPLGHEYTDEYVSDATYHWKKCVRCDYTTAKEEHTADDGKCATCKREICTSNEYFIFTLLDDDTYSVRAKDVNIMPNNVIIPSTYNGKTVTFIEDKAFWNCQNLTSITIPKSITAIGEYAFSNCDNLTNVYISDISAWCNITFKNSGACPLNYAQNLYLNNNLITELIIPNDIVTISDFAFHRYYNLYSVVISDTVTSIGDWTFSWCINLSNVEFGENIITIGIGTFNGCIELTNVIIPDNTTCIGDQAFQDCLRLNCIEIGNGITTIGNYTFFGCNVLQSIIIPDSVILINDDAFKSCNRLTDVYYTGTEEEWAAIIIGSGNEYLTDATIHYNYVPEE